MAGSHPARGALLACSFWLVDALLLIGREEDSCRLFDRLLGLRNDLGLLSEDYDTDARRLVGNFPRAFSHIGLVNSAHNLGRATKPAEQRASR
jgi:GH15 family glucan-1,4-alpha-glucosidase